MSAYLIADVEVKNAVAYEKYSKAVPAVIAAHGGKYLVRGGKVEILEGSWAPRRTVVVEFASMASLQAFYASPEYQPLKNLRRAASDSRLVAVEGL